jgi:hypothetical protein
MVWAPRVRAARRSSRDTSGRCRGRTSMSSTAQLRRTTGGRCSGNSIPRWCGNRARNRRTKTTTALPCVDQVLHLEIEVLPLLLDVGHIPQIRVGADEDPLLVQPPTGRTPLHPIRHNRESARRSADRAIGRASARSAPSRSKPEPPGDAKRAWKRLATPLFPANRRLATAR